MSLLERHSPCCLWYHSGDAVDVTDVAASLVVCGDGVFVSGDVVALGGVGLGDGVVCAYAMVAIAGIAAAAVRILNFISMTSQVLH
jgi:hypothetical protein